MPNIEICGYTAREARQLKRDIDNVMAKLGHSGAITSIKEMDARSCDGKNKRQPYLRICETDVVEIKRIVSAFIKANIAEDT